MEIGVDTDFIREVPLELSDPATPVVGGLLRDELDVEEAALSRPVVLARRHAADYARGHVGHQVLGNERVLI